MLQSNPLRSVGAPARPLSPPNDYQYYPDRYCHRAGDWRERDLFILVDLDMQRSHVNDIPAGSIGNASVDKPRRAEHNQNHADNGHSIHKSPFLTHAASHRLSAGN